MDIASSLNIAFSFGIVLVSFVSGQAVNLGGLRSTALVAALLLAVTIVLMLVENRLEIQRQELAVGSQLCK